jgi:hypothetical protein
MYLCGVHNYVSDIHDSQIYSKDDIPPDCLNREEIGTNGQSLPLSSSVCKHSSKSITAVPKQV